MSYYFCIFLFKTFARFFYVTLHKRLLEYTFLPFLIVLDNLYQVFGCFVISDFIFTVSKIFAGYVIISDCFNYFLFFFLENDSECSLALRGSGTF